MRVFDLLVDRQLLATQQLNCNKPGAFFDVEYPLPAEAPAGKDAITVRFQPREGNVARGLFR